MALRLVYDDGKHHGLHTYIFQGAIMHYFDLRFVLIGVLSIIWSRKRSPYEGIRMGSFDGAHWP